MQNYQPTKTNAVYSWIIITVAAFFYCYEYFLRITPNVMVAELRHVFQIDAAQFGNMVAFYYYAYTPLQLPVGMLMDRYGARRLLTMACFVCALGALVFGYQHLLFYSKLGRLLMGFGSAFAFVGVLALAAQWFSNRLFAFIAGLTTTLGMLGAMQGEVLLVYLTQYMGWRETYIYSAVAGFVLSVIIFVIIRDHPNQEKKQAKLNWREFFSHVLLIVKQSQIWIVGIIGALFYLSLSVFAELWGIPFLIEAYQVTNHQAAVAVGMVYLGWAVGGPLVGILSDRFNTRILPMAIFSLIAAVCIAAVIYLPFFSYQSLCWMLFAYGLFCSAEIVVFAFGKEHAPDDCAGTAIAVVNMLVMMSGALLQPSVGYLLEWFWLGNFDHHGIRIYQLIVYQKALAVLPIGLVIASALTYFLKDKRHSQPETSQ